MKELKLKLTRENVSIGVRQIVKGGLFAVGFVGRMYNPFQIEPTHYPLKPVIEIHKISKGNALMDQASSILAKESSSIVVQAPDGSGSSGLPGADGFSPNTFKPHKIPRMRSQTPDGIKGLNNVPKQFYRPTTDVSSTQRDNPQCPIKKFNPKKEYEFFMKDMSQKGITIECDYERFRELSVNPETGNIDEKSLIEAKGCLQGEGKQLYRKLERIDDPDVRADFKAEDIKTDKTIFVEHKAMIDFKTLEEKGIDISNYPSHERVAYNMGVSIPKQKTHFLGLPNGPKSTEDVLHLVNFDQIRDPLEKPSLINATLAGAEDHGNSENIVFINYE